MMKQGATIMEQQKDQPSVSIGQVIKWMGTDQVNLRLALEQIDLLNQEINRLNALLSTCKCERKDAENSG